MKKIFLFIIFLFINKNIYSQDSLLEKPQYIIGFEFQQTPLSLDLTKQPGYNLFYRFMLPNNKKYITMFTGNILYRRGYGYNSEGGKGGGSSIYGDYEFFRLVVGIGQQIRLGRKKKFMIGSSLNFGHMIYSNGNIRKDNFSNGIQTNTKGNSSEALFSNYLSVNIEISKVFELTNSHHLIAGLKQYFETPDFVGSNANYSSSLFIAYNIR